ncbi:MAG: glycosyltransferase [Prevotellaceae bacterium]|jgi:glycosyltransferase involved in cell wall biosynthesis|nr:glycosyltransferase [Prevotellaceae bacterium]
MFYSVIIPVYNRPDEIDELLSSLTEQTYKNFEVLIVEDGSDILCKDVADKYMARLDLRYYTKRNEGPALARNYGAARSRGDYLIILDSDCLLPPAYMETVNQALESEPSDAYGAPDRAHPSFSLIQKAINYSMTSFFTTGGIRGGSRRMERFHPRSFNMGVRRTVFMALEGFADMRQYGEDIDFSIRIHQSGYSCRLLPEAWVYHKRRSTLRQFFRQVRRSGEGRIALARKYPGSLKLVHLLPASFTVGIAACLLLSIACTPYFLLPILVFALLVFTEATLRNHSVRVGVLAIAASYVQLTGYGIGFLRAYFHKLSDK